MVGYVSNLGLFIRYGAPSHRSIMTIRAAAAVTEPGLAQMSAAGVRAFTRIAAL
jgi:hypothetical protein